MHEENGAGTAPRSLEQLLLAGIGWVSVGAEAADAARRRDREACRREPRPRCARLFATLSRAGVTTSIVSATCAPRWATGHCSVLGLVRREEVDDLALRIAQLEHRMRLLERPDAPPAA